MATAAASVSPAKYGVQGIERVGTNGLGSQVVVVDSVAHVSPVTCGSAGGDTASQTAAVLRELDTRLEKVRSTSANVITMSVQLSATASVDEFTAAVQTNASWAAVNPVVSYMRVNEIVQDSSALVSVAVTAATMSDLPPPGVVSTDDAASAVGPYSQAIIANDGTVYISGCIGLTTGPDAGMAGDTVEEQTKQVLSNLSAILKAAGCNPDDIVKTTVLLADMGDFATVNGMYAEFFSGGRVPARACFAAKTLPKGALVEIEAVAKQNKQ